MKSSTRNQANVRSLGADKRLDVLVRKQEAEHKHLLSGHHKEMQELREQLKLAQERFESLSKKNESDLKDFGEGAARHVAYLRERVEVQERIISEHKSSIDSLQQQLLNFQVLYSSLRDVDNVKKEMESQIREATQAHLCSLQDLQRQFKIDLRILFDSLEVFKVDADRRLSEQSNRIEERYNLNKVDRDSVLQEIRSRQWELLVIEKKIENIYTLIERINKRGELCHKQG